MTDDEIMALASIVADLAKAGDPYDSENDECVLCGNYIDWRQEPLLRKPRLDRHAESCPWRRAKELFS